MSVYIRVTCHGTHKCLTSASGKVKLKYTGLHKNQYFKSRSLSVCLCLSPVQRRCQHHRTHPRTIHCCRTDIIPHTSPGATTIRQRRHVTSVEPTTTPSAQW